MLPCPWTYPHILLSKEFSFFARWFPSTSGTYYNIAQFIQITLSYPNFPFHYNLYSLPFFCNTTTEKEIYTHCPDFCFISSGDHPNRLLSSHSSLLQITRDPVLSLRPAPLIWPPNRIWQFTHSLPVTAFLPWPVGHCSSRFFSVHFIGNLPSYMLGNTAILSIPMSSRRVLPAAHTSSPSHFLPHLCLIHQ